MTAYDPCEDENNHSDGFKTGHQKFDTVGAKKVVRALKFFGCILRGIAEASTSYQLPTVLASGSCYKALKEVRQMADAIIHVMLYNGRRTLLRADSEVLLRLTNGAQEVTTITGNGPVYHITVPFTDGPDDRYTVHATATGYVDAGFHPVDVNPLVCQTISLMLLPHDGQYNCGLRNGCIFLVISRPRSPQEQPMTWQHNSAMRPSWKTIQRALRACSTSSQQCATSHGV